MLPFDMPPQPPPPNQAEGDFAPSSAPPPTSFDLPYDFQSLLNEQTDHQQDGSAQQQQLIDLLTAMNSSLPTSMPGQNAFAQFNGQNSFAAPIYSQPDAAAFAQAAAAANPDLYNTFRGTSTGSSAFSVDGVWDDHEFAFTPLVSPAMTPLSTLLSPQVQGLKAANGTSLVSPAEVFSPLSSPALRPQDAQGMQDSPNYARLNEQASNLGLDGFRLPHALGMSPVIQPTRSTNGGGGHGRGASRTSAKARPSPIIKPTNRSARPSVLPPAPAIESAASTPSPLDIDISMAVATANGLMPPPPLPPHASVPATPSSLMNLGPEVAQPYSVDANISPALGPRRTGRKGKDGKVSARNSVEFAPIASTSTAANMAPEDRRTSHRAAEQRRRDSLKLCFEELRPLLPHIPPEEDEEAAASRRPGEGNVAGQRTAGMDPRFPNKGVSKVALLRKSNAYIAALEKRIRARDEAIRGLCERFGMTEEEVVVDDWEEEWPWNGRPGDEGHSPFSAEMMAENGGEMEDDRPKRTSSRRTSRRSSLINGIDA